MKNSIPLILQLYQLLQDTTGVNNLDTSKFDTRNVLDMSKRFLDNTNLINLDVSSFDTKNDLAFSEIFVACSNIKTLFPFEFFLLL